jgi:geranylgeranyl reductase family protein
MRIAIVGAGPAGAMAAIRLADAGAPVWLFDASHPREKACGGGVTGRALALIADAVDLAALPAVVVKSATVLAPADRIGGHAEVDLIDRGVSPGSSLVVLSRAVFDAALAEAAVRRGARLVAEKVAKVTRRNHAMVITTPQGEYDADFVIGADGANSLVRRTFWRPFTRAELSIAAGYFVHGARSSEIAIKCIAEQPGYLWSFPRADHLAVGICTRATEYVTAGELGSQSLAWIASHALERGARTRERLEPYAWPIPSAGFGGASDVVGGGPGWMLAGDAAGLVDPLTREGIYYALVSGHWAADALLHSPALAAATYEQRLKEEIYPELNRAAALSEAFFSPRFSNLFVSALRESGPIREVFRDLVAGTQPYTRLKRRLLATHEWKLAGRAALMMVQFRRNRGPHAGKSAAAAAVRPVQGV